MSPSSPSPKFASVAGKESGKAKISVIRIKDRKTAEVDAHGGGNGGGGGRGATHVPFPTAVVIVCLGTVARNASTAQKAPAPLDLDDLDFARKPTPTVAALHTPIIVVVLGLFGTLVPR